MTALAAPAAPVPACPTDLGRFRWDIDGATVAWSDSVHRLLGYRPGRVVPSAALALRHKHPDDLHDYVDALHAGLQLDRLVVHEHRVVDTRGAVRSAVLVARPTQDGPGPARQLSGFLLATDTGSHPAADLPGRRGAATLVPVLVHAFGVSAETASVLLAACRRVSAGPARERSAAAPDRADSRRRNLEDVLFPLEHLALPAVELAA